MKKIMFIALVVLLSSCMTEKRQNRLKKLLCKDYTTTVIKDSLIQIPVYYADSATMYLNLACDSQLNIYQVNSEIMQGKYSHLQSLLLNNKVYVHSKVIIHDTIKETVTNTVIKEGTHTTTNIITWWQKTCLIGFPVLLILIILYIIYRIYKPKFGFSRFLK